MTAILCRRSLHVTLALGVLATGGCTGSVGPDASGGEKAIGPGSGAGTAAGPAGQLLSESGARRLSQAEFDNVLADVLGESKRSASQILLEDEFTPYDNDYTLQQASQALIDGLQSLAETVARAALSDPVRRAQLVPCTPTGPADATCFRSVIQTLGQRLLRRPLRAEEVDAYLTLQEFSTENNPHVDNDFYTGVELFLRSVLQDPEFLYRIETAASAPNTDRTLDSFEVATRLSFLITGSTPDDTLLAQATTGSLGTASLRRAQATRLLDSERARTQMHRFHAMWLGYRTIPHSAALSAAFDAETGALIDRVVFDEERGYLDLFTLGETQIDATLAQHYGLPVPAGGRAWVSYGDTGRAGILSHGSVLSAFSKFSDTSPTQRGILVRARLMCQEVPPPPANVDVDQPPGDPSAVCKIDRYAEHRRSSSCANCHALIDPVGFGLERYDMAGGWRDHEEGLPSCSIDGRGELPGYGAFSGPGELGQKLVKSGLLDACAVRQYLTFAIGRRPRPAEQAQLDAALAEFRAGGHDLSEWILDLVASDGFAQRRESAP